MMAFDRNPDAREQTETRGLSLYAGFALLLVCMLIASPCLAQIVTGRVPVGSGATAITVNSVTNKVYVANRDDGTVTVINGATNATATVGVGTLPGALAVNPATNRIYVANRGGNSVTVIDGATNATVTVGVGGQPVAVAVNPVTNKVYVANQSDNTVTMIDGVLNSTATVPVGLGPVALAINTATNKVYVANSGESTVTEIDGWANTTTTVAINKPAAAVAIDSGINMVYVALPGSGTGFHAIEQIDGATHAILGLVPSVSGSAVAITANSATHNIYALLNHATVHDWDASIALFSNGETLYYFGSTIAGESYSLAIDQTSGRWYSVMGATLAVMDGSTNILLAAYSGEFFAVAANPATGRVYVSEYGPHPYGNNVLVLSNGVDLGITKSGVPNPAITGSEVTYNLIVTNHGPGDATQVVVTDPLPPGASAVSCTTTLGTCAGSTRAPSVIMDTLAAGSSASITLRATIACTVRDNATLTNTASVTAIETDPNPGDNSASAAITVADPPPILAGLSVDPAVLWPPNHNMVDITVSYRISDNCALPAGACTLDVTTNEPPNGPGDGNTSPDWVIVDAHHVRLRAERSGKGQGRLYTIDVTCTDSGGGSARQSVQVQVPKNRA